MKKLAILILHLSFYSFCNAQSLAQEVVSSAGDVFYSSGGSLEWTLGEIVTETFEKGNYILTQGFHQPEKILSNQEFGYAAYPNPVPDYLNVRVVKQGYYLAEVFNLWGQKLIAQNINLNPDGTTFKIDMRWLDSALYVVRIVSISTGESVSFKIEKI